MLVRSMFALAFVIMGSHIARADEPQAPVPTPPPPAAPETEENPYGELFSSEEFRGALDAHFDSRIEPFNERLGAVEEEVADLRTTVSEMPGRLAAQQQDLIAGQVGIAMDKREKQQVAAIKQEVVPYLLDKLAEKGQLVRKGQAPGSAATPAAQQTTVPAQQATAPPQQFRSEVRYQRHSANGRGFVYVQEPVDGFPACAHCNAGKGQMCGQTGPINIRSRRPTVVMKHAAPARPTCTSSGCTTNHFVQQ